LIFAVYKTRDFIGGGSSSQRANLMAT